jgi:hypothetical protein
MLTRYVLLDTSFCKQAGGTQTDDRDSKPVVVDRDPSIAPCALSAVTAKPSYLPDMAPLCFLPCAPQQPRRVRPGAGGPARCTSARTRRPRTRVQPCGVRMLGDSDGPPAATAPVNKDATAQGPPPPPPPQAQATAPTPPRAAGRGKEKGSPPPPVMNIEDRQEMLEMYYDADDTTYQANLANVWGTYGTRSILFSFVSLSFIPWLGARPRQCTSRTFESKQVRVHTGADPSKCRFFFPFSFSF